MESIGPYTYVLKDETVKYPNGRSLRFLLYGAYNAMGLIGTECNGIAVLDEDNKRVVADEIAKDSGAYMKGTPRQFTRFELITKAPWDQVAAEVNESGRARFNLLSPPEFTVKRGLKLSQKCIREFIDLAEGSPIEAGRGKEQFARTAKTIARKIAKLMGLTPKDYRLSYNPGGRAVCGDVILHTDRLYVNFSQSCLGPNFGFMYRKCNGRKDYTGGVNRWMKWNRLADLEDVAATFKAEAESYS